MLVTYTEAFLEEGLSELARRNPELLLRDGGKLDYSRTWEVDSLEELRAELREQCTDEFFSRYAADKKAAHSHE